MAGDCIFIIDTFSLMFQVFHAIPPMTGTQGQPTNAVFGFTRDIFAILDRKPTHLICAFDSPGDGHRNTVYADYKANRSEMPEDLRPQIPLIKDLLNGFRIPVVEHAAWEADDVIATVTRQASDAGMDVVIVSSDKDIRQLLRPNVRLLNCRKNEFLDEAGLMADWGIRPDQVVDYQSLVGDTADNVPGVPKVGPKTAKALIDQFGDLDTILASTAQVSGKALQKNLTEFADQARMCRELVRLRTDLPLNFQLEDARIREPDRNTLFDLFNRLGFRRYSAMMRPEKSGSSSASAPTNSASGLFAASESASSVASSQNSPADIGSQSETHSQQTSSGGSSNIGSRADDSALISTLSEERDVDAFLQSLTDSSDLVLDAVVSGVFLRDLQLVYLGISCTSSDSSGRDPGQTGGPEKRRVLISGTAGTGKQTAGVSPGPSSLLTRVLQRLAEFRGTLVLADSRPFLHACLNCGLTLKARIMDLSVMDYLVDAGARSHSLSDIADRYAHSSLMAGETQPARKVRQKTMFDDDDTDNETPDKATGSAAVEIAAVSTTIAQRLVTMETLFPELQAEMDSAGLTDLYETLERPLLSLLIEMEHHGISVDAQELQRQSEKASIRIEQLTAEVFAAAGYEFNVDSPKQLSEILYQKLRLPVLKKTRTGASTDQEVLEQLALIHPLPAKIIERRQLVKLRGTYLDALPALIHPATGRIHAKFHQTVAATGRLSCSDPNLQNIPIRTEEGRQIRRAFRPGIADSLLVCADYSQIELRVLAHFSGDEAMKDAFRCGIDIHAAVASEVFQIPVDQVTSEQRRVAKAVNFGLIYGQSPFGLAAALNIDRSEATDFIDRYFQKYQGVAGFFEKVLEEALRTGYVRTILNRRRAISGIRNTTGLQRNMPERTAINTVIQGSAADLIKKAMLDVSGALDDSGLRASMLLQIHDELVFEVHQEDAEKLIEVLVPGMQNAMNLQVPLVVDITKGRNWLEQTDG